MKFSLLAALEVVETTTSSAASDKNFVTDDILVSIYCACIRKMEYILSV